MRTLVLLVLFGCAAKNANPGTPQPSPAPVTAMDPVMMRACDSCRHNLELCRNRSTAATASGPVSTECMNEFMTCVSAQQLDTAQCQGLN